MSLLNFKLVSQPLLKWVRLVACKLNHIGKFEQIRDYADKQSHITYLSIQKTPDEKNEAAVACSRHMQHTNETNPAIMKVTG